jgi:2-dehydropantoate 2-reductase
LPRLKNKPSYLLLQNGWGSTQEAKNILPQQTPVYSGIIMTGLERLSPSRMHVHVHADAIQTGSLFGESADEIEPLIAVSKRGFFPFHYESEIEPVMLTKLIYNICLNPLGALQRKTYGELLSDEPTLELMGKISGEGIGVLGATRGFCRFADGKEYVRGVLVPKLASKVAAHRSSMLQDLEAGRRTEIDYLNGAIAAMGRAHSIATPHNDRIVSLIRAAEGKIPS